MWNSDPVLHLMGNSDVVLHLIGNSDGWVLIMTYSSNIK